MVPAVALSPMSNSKFQNKRIIALLLAIIGSVEIALFLNDYSLRDTTLSTVFTYLGGNFLFQCIRLLPIMGCVRCWEESGKAVDAREPAACKFVMLRS